MEKKKLEELTRDDLHILNHLELIILANYLFGRIEELEDMVQDMGTELDRWFENHNPLGDFP